MALLKIPDVPVQSQPLTEERGEPLLPVILHHAYWLFLHAFQSVMQLMASAINTLQADVVTLQDAVSLERKAQADLAALAATLTAADAGLLVEVTDYRHVLRWSGSVWTWGPGEDGRHDIVGLPVDPDDTTGWQLCDGTTVAYLKGDGTTANFATPDLTSAANKAAYLKLGTPVSGPNAATAPGFSGSGATTGATSGGTPAGTNSAPAFTGNAIGFTTNTAANAAGLTFLTGPATQNITGSVAAPTFTGSALATHTHSVTAAGTVDATGEPRNYELRPWFRR